LLGRWKEKSKKAKLARRQTAFGRKENKRGPEDFWKVFDSGLVYKTFGVTVGELVLFSILYLIYSDRVLLCLGPAYGQPMASLWPKEGRKEGNVKCIM
jgi:hypothetical protein